MGDTPETTGEKRKPVPPVEHRFKPGNPGRPKGSRNKLGEAFLQALHEDFNKHGVGAIEKVRDEKPEHYLKVIASILPKELNVNVNEMDALTDDELIARLRDLDRIVQPFLVAAGEAGSGEGSGAATAH